MSKSKIYTKTGDSGETGLVSGTRILKSDFRIDLYGELDELNSRLGLCHSLMRENPRLSENDQKKTINFMTKLQSAIFDLGSNLACEEKKRELYNLPQISDKILEEMEKEIDDLDSQLEPLKNFILPGGSLLAASLHLARTNTRSVERKLVLHLQTSQEKAPENAVKFLNRLSDYLFVLARYVNKVAQVEETLWVSSH